MDASNPLPQDHADLVRTAPRRIVVIANKSSGTNARDSEAIDRAVAALGEDRTHVTCWTPGEDLDEIVDREIADGADIIVAAGGDGTAMAVSQAMLGKDCALAVLPLGTFNYFARGLGLSEDPEEAARAILDGRPHDIRIGMVNDQVFLNNASLGIYPSILKERETVYRKWGRRRIMAHWSVVKTFLRFQRPMRLRLKADGTEETYRTPLLFVARSIYQLEMFGLKGEDAIRDDAFAVLIGRGQSRWNLFKLAWRLVFRRMKEGRDYDLLPAKSLTVETSRKRTLVAFDGEKTRDRSPFEFRMSDRPLRIILPPKPAASGQ